jgi:uncharacterized membrane protein
MDDAIQKNKIKKINIMESTTKSRAYLWFILFFLMIPFIYLAYVWNILPEQVPLHFDIHGKPNGFGSPLELLFALLFMAAITLGVTLILTNIHKIDPKRANNSIALMRKISLFLAFFFSGLMVFIVYLSSSGHLVTPQFMLAALSLLFAFLGNLMNNLKPNYFVGIRTPWTLENEVVWRKTHHFASRLWFFGGTLEALLVLLLPDAATIVIFTSVTAALVVIPLVYSYRVYKDLKK